jgi:hypothetical protein
MGEDISLVFVYINPDVRCSIGLIFMPSATAMTPRDNEDWLLRSSNQRSARDELYPSASTHDLFWRPTSLEQCIKTENQMNTLHL